MKFIKLFISIILLFSYTYLVYLINDFGLLSNIYVLIFLLAALMFLIILTIKLLKSTTLLKSIIIIIIFVVISIINIFIFIYINKAFNFINKISSKKNNYDNYYVLVLKKSSYNKLSDLKNKNIGYLSSIDNSAIKKLEINYNEKTYDDNQKLINDLYDKNLNAVLLSDVSTYLLEEQDKDFSSKVRVLYTIKVKKKTTEENDKEEEKDVSKEPFVMYISGIDTNGAISKVSRSDVNIIATINPNNNEVLLTTIPRDYYVQLHGTTGYKDKLTHSGIYGIDMSINTIEDLLDVDISYYLRVNFDTLINLVDELDGIDVYSDREFVPWTNKSITIPKGLVHMDGKMALAFARERYAYETGDRHRGENQEAVIKAIIEKVQNSKVLLTKYNSILKKLGNSFETNISDDFIKDLIKLQSKTLANWNIKNYNLNGSDSNNYTYSTPSTKLYVMEPDVTTLENAKRIIKEIISGKSLSEIEI